MGKKKKKLGGDKEEKIGGANLTANTGSSANVGGSGANTGGANTE